MASIAEATVTLRGDGGQLEGDVTKIAGGIARTFAGIAVAKGVFDFIKDGVTQLGELERVGAQTNAVIKSTGGVANVSAKSVLDFGQKIESLTGIDQEQIQVGENLLLTFRGIQNQAGKGNDIFDRARMLAVDLSVAWGQDMSASAVQLGKALENPVAGMTALQRVGITFSESQKETIKTMVETGDVLGAQKIILEELEKQVGGSAEAFGTTLPAKMAIAKQAIGDVQQSIAVALLPAIEFGATAITGMAGAVEGLPGPVQTATAVIGGLAASTILLARPLSSTITFIGQVAPAIGGAVIGLKNMATGMFTTGSGTAAAAGQMQLFSTGAGVAGAAATGLSVSLLGATALVAGAVIGIGALGLGLGKLTGAYNTTIPNSQAFGKSLVDMKPEVATMKIAEFASSIQSTTNPLREGINSNIQYEASHVALEAAAKKNVFAAVQLRDELIKHPALMQELGFTTGELTRIVETQATKFAENRGAVDLSKQATIDYGLQLANATTVVDEIKTALENFNITISASISPILGAMGATINYQQSVDDLTAALFADTTGMDINEAAGRNVAAALLNLTGSSIETTQAQIALAIANGDTAKAEDLAAMAAQGLVTDILASGAAAGVSAGDMINYTGTILGIPPDAMTWINNTADPAAALVQYLIDKINAIPPSKETTITANIIENRYFNTYSRNFGSQGSPLGTWAEHGLISMAGGSVTRGPTPALIGEAGPEAVVPLGGSAMNTRDRDRIMKRAGLFQVQPMASGGTSGAYSGGGGSDKLLAEICALLRQVVANQSSSGERKPSRAIIGARS